MKNVEKVLFQNVFPRNGPQTMTSIKKIQTYPPKHTRKDLYGCRRNDIVLQVNCARR